MVRGKLITASLLLSAMSLAGCSQKPLPSMDQFLGITTPQKEQPAQTPAATGPFDVGLLLVNETSGEGLAPAISDRGRAFLTDQVRKRTEAGTPIRVVKVLTVADPSQHRDLQSLSKLAQEQGLSHLLIALFSSSESEVPAYLSILGGPEQGGGRGDVLGIQTDNFALVELALIDATNVQVVARSDGRAWSRLDQLNVPVKSNAYPVIHRSQRNPPIFPPEGQEKDVLRSIAGDEALEQAVSKLGQDWPKS